MNLKESKYIWILPDSNTRWIWTAFGQKLLKELQLPVIMLVRFNSDKEFFEKQFGNEFRCEIVVFDDPYMEVLYGKQNKYSNAENVEYLKQYELQNSVSIMRTMALSDRMLGHGFIISGKGHPKSQLSRTASLENLAKAYATSIRFVEKTAAQFPPALVIGYARGGGLFDKPISLFCRSNDIPLRMLVSGRFGDLFCWTDNEYLNSPRANAFIRDRLLNKSNYTTQLYREKRSVEETLAPNILAGPEAIQGILKSLTWRSIIYTWGYRVLRKIYARIRGFEHGKIDYDNISFLLYRIRARLHYKFLTNKGISDLKAVRGKKLVYFPLQEVPEQSTLIVTPNFTNQLAIIHELALALPIDAVLLVKEHLFQMGRRELQFYKTLIDMPNVILVDPRYSGLDLIKMVDVVCTISSSSAFEAAALGKHVLSFESGSVLGEVPHVTILNSSRDMDNIVEILHQLENGADLRKDDGAHFYHAVEDFCFSIPGGNILNRVTAASDEIIDLLYSHLFVSLEDTIQFGHQLEKEAS